MISIDNVVEQGYTRRETTAYYVGFIGLGLTAITLLSNILLR